MIISVGTKNAGKLEAVRGCLKDYPALAEAEVIGREVASGVADQPLSQEETIRGAMNRAKAAFQDCAYSIGLESGLMAVPYTKSGYMDFCACVIYDGRECFLGLSSAWEFADPRMMDMLLKDRLTMTDAANLGGYSSDPKLGDKGGIIGILTKGRIDRIAYTKQAITMALIHIDT